MGFFKNIFNKSKKSIKFSASDPSTFVEVWSFTSTRIRVLSLFLVLFVVFGFGVLFAFGGIFSDYTEKDDVSIEREQVEEYHKSIKRFHEVMTAQERYIAAQTMVISGEFPTDTDLDSLQKTIKVDNSIFDLNPTKSDREMSKKVRNDMRTVKDNEASIPYFKSPVEGVVSQAFDKNHQGIDIVTEKDHTVKACLSGTVIYSGYTRKDGYILIIDHGNEYMSVYKHNKKALKKMGAKIQLGDPIAIVGNTGENTDGPHLHFELWYKQVPVNPEDYLQFKR